MQVLDDANGRPLIPRTHNPAILMYRKSKEKRNVKREQESRELDNRDDLGTSL
jgi:hypothetical protein